MTQNISGTYKLKDYGYTSKKDGSFKPISDFYTGTIHYSETGFMSVIVRFAEAPTDFSEIVSYSGSYKVDGNKIINTVTESVRPDYVGQRLDRIFNLTGKILTTEFENTEEFVKSATWEKINP